MRRALAIGASVLALLGTQPPALALPLGGNPPPPPSDLLAACLATAGWNQNEWKDLSTCPLAGAHQTLASVAYNCASACAPGPTSGSIFANSGPPAVMLAWGGGAWDSDDKFLIVWGGGHDNYHGNEVYTYSLTALDWERNTLPDNVDGSGCAINGGPSSTHTYGSLVYNTTAHLFMALGDNATPIGCATNIAWTMRPATASPVAYQAWTPHDSVNANISFAQVAAYDPVADLTYVLHCAACQGSGTNGIHIFNLNAAPGSQWTTRGSTAATADDNEHMAFNRTSGNLVGFGGALAGSGCGVGCVDVVTVSSGASVRFNAVLGDSTCLGTAAPGVSDDATLGKIRVWCGGKTTYTMDDSTSPPTLTADLTGVGGATPACSQVINCTSSTGYQITGTYGRFQCLQPTYNVCIVVNTTDDHVYAKRF